MTDDDLTTGALFVGAGIAGYALGRFVLGKKQASPEAAPRVTSPAAPSPTASVAIGSTAPAQPAAPSPAPTQARPSTVSTRPRRPRPIDDADDGPVTSPDQVDTATAPDEVGPVSSPSEVEQPAPTAASPITTGSARYDARAARLVESIGRRVERTRELIAAWPTFLDRYRGGLPRGVFAAVMQMESNGMRTAKGDSRLGELGLFQITEELPRSLGLDPRLRYDNEWNFYFAGVEYNQAAARWVRRFRSLIEDGSVDAWKLSRLSFAIGDGGARAHAKRAVQAHRDIAEREGVYPALLALVRGGGARKAGSQSAALVAYRIAVAVPATFLIGQQAEPGDYGLPVALAAPQGRTAPR